MLETTYYETTTNYIFFKNGDLSKTINGEIIEFPDYINRCAKRYRFDVDRLILQKQCSKCLEWFNVCLLENNDFTVINNEKEIHYFGASGFENNCYKKCKNSPKKGTKPKNKVSIIDNPPTPNDSEIEKTYLNIIIPKYLKKYLKTQACIQDSNITKILITLIEDYARDNPINIESKK